MHPVRWSSHGRWSLARRLLTDEGGERPKLREAKGKRITPADAIAGEGACRGLGNLGHSVDIAFDFDTEFSWHPVRPTQ